MPSTTARVDPGQIDRNATAAVVIVVAVVAMAVTGVVLLYVSPW